MKKLLATVLGRKNLVRPFIGAETYRIVLSYFDPKLLLLLVCAFDGAFNNVQIIYFLSTVSGAIYCNNN